MLKYKKLYEIRNTDLKQAAPDIIDHLTKSQYMSGCSDLYDKGITFFSATTVFCDTTKTDNIDFPGYDTLRERGISAILVEFIYDPFNQPIK